MREWIIVDRATGEEGFGDLRVIVEPAGTTLRLWEPKKK